MAENKMNNPEPERNVGGRTGNTGNEGQQAPGRNLNEEQSTGQRGGERGGDQGTERKDRGQGSYEGGDERDSDSRGNR